MDDNLKSARKNRMEKSETGSEMREREKTKNTKKKTPVLHY